jgi:hypothetical protein
MMNQCLEILKRDEFKREFKQIMSPLFSFFMETLKPYLICLCIIILFHTFLLMSLLYLFTKIFYK